MNTPNFLESHVSQIPAIQFLQQLSFGWRTTADAELHLLRHQRTALDQQKRGLMQQLLTGKMRVST